MNFATSESTAAARRIAVIAAIAMIAVAATATFFGQGRAIEIPAILPLIVGCVVVSEIMSAYVLFAEFARSRLVWLVFVAAAYLLTAVLAVPYVLTFPEVFAPSGLLGASAQTALHVWVLWHLAFPALVLAAVLVGRLPYDVRLERASTASLFIVLAIAAGVLVGSSAPVLSEIFGKVLPDLIRERTFTAATTTVVLPLILALDVLALVVLYQRTRNRSAIVLWLFIALVASALDAVMGVLSSRYSYGWYVGKVFLVISSSVMLVGFIGETGKLRTRLGRANDDLKVTRERERYLAQERVHRLAHYDELTGLASRLQLGERLSELAIVPAPGNRFTVLFVSLVAFKGVNEQFGRVAADRVLTDVAARLTANVRHGDTVARFSGDEFVVLAPSSLNQESAETLAETLRRALCAPFDVMDGVAHIAAAIGVAMFPDDGSSAEGVLDNADAAARQGKTAGGNRVTFYSRAFFEKARERRRLQDDLSIAILHDEFVLKYQPIVDLRTGELEKVEALIRWIHPERGTVPPNAFIPLAEQTGLMELIGYWVIEEAVRQASAWDAIGTPTRIAVNVSARQLDDRGFLPHLTRTLDEARISPKFLELEITESAAMTDASLAQDVLEQCRSLGLCIALDDFGTYYSSLTYLKRLPINCVKIDRSFIQGLPFVKSDAAIVSGILGLTRALERTAVAEGIETEQQRAWLARAGCEFGQGYLLGRPMSAAALSDWRRDHRSLAAVAGAGAGR
jgi:diguanylate cyclase (GGDEF)-like protein